GARKAQRLLKRPERLLAALSFGNRLVKFTAAALGAALGMRFLGEDGVLLAPILIGLLFLLFADVAPKTLATQRPEAVAFPSAYVLQPLLVLLRPAAAFMNVLSRGLARPFSSPVSADSRLSEDELRTMVTDAANLSPADRAMVLGVLDLDRITVDDIMVPRDEIVGIDINAPFEQVIEILSTAQHTRLPVWQDGMRVISGVLHLRRVAHRVLESHLSLNDLLNLLEPAYYVPSGTSLEVQLGHFRREKRRLALVVDEYGDVQGLVTLDDILEEIVGQFTTDLTASAPEISPQPDGSVVIDGRANLRDINRSLAWDLPVEGPKTLNGLVLEHLEALPESNVSLALGRYRIETLLIQGSVIRALRVTRLSAPAPIESGHDGVE
ncbi:MAG: HlyC/CorC family transporter, partial [Pseudomonadales bacterium]